MRIVILLLMSLVLVSCEHGNVSSSSNSNSSNDSPTLPVGWKTADGLIAPQCFSTKTAEAYSGYPNPTPVGNVYGIYADHFKISNYNDFLYNPGKYLGKEIPTLDPLKISNVKIYLATPYDSCLKKKTVENGNIYDITLDYDINITGEEVDGTTCDAVDCTLYTYSITKKVSPVSCSALMPNIKGKCDESYLIQISDVRDGHSHNNYGIYGLVSLNDTGNTRYIVPLKFFDKLNDAMSYIK